ncbi:MAG: AAA family ATPase [Planctomycetes bacterium]|nr:AAA family ATPase [Planctomycetota bacterium]
MTLQRIHKITVENWRSWQGPSTLEDLRPGLVVLGGPNAVGKSGLWEAIVLGLLDRHWGSHTDSLRPAGTKRVIPRVEIEFDAGGRRFKVEKHFGGAGGRDKASFHERVDSRWVLRDQGEEAYGLCRKAVLGADSEAPSRGGLEYAVQGTLLQILLPRQGTLVEQTKASQAVSVAVTDRAAAATATRIGRVLGSVSEEADRWWAAQRGALKRGTDLARDIERLEAIDAPEGEVARLEAKVRRIDELVGRLAAASEELAGLGDAGRRLEEAEALNREASEHRERREAARKAFDDASRMAADLEAVREARRRLSEDLARREEALQKASRELGDKADQRQRADRSLKEREDERDKLAGDLERHRAWTEFETRGARLKELRTALDSVKARSSTVEACRKEIEGLRREKGGLPLPRQEEWEAWDELERAHQEAEGRLKAGAWTVEGSLPPGLALKLDGQAVAGPAVSARASRAVVVSAASGEALRIEAPEKDATEAARLGRAKGELLARFGAADIRDLRKRHTYVTGTLDPKVATAQGRMQEALQGARPEDLLREEGRLASEIERKEGLQAPEGARPLGEPEEWRVRVELLEDERSRAEERLKVAAAEAASAATDEARSRAAHSEAQKARDATFDALTLHRQEHGPDDAVERAAVDALRAKVEKEGFWKPLEEERDAAEAAKETRARGLREGLKEILARQARIKEMQGELAEIRREDPEGSLAKLLAERAVLAPRVRAGKTHADALLLLEGALKEERDRLTQAIGGPVRERLQRWVRYLLQDSSEVVVGEDGWPRVIRTATGQEVPYEDQSFGTREQVGVLYRLAVADLLAEASKAGACLLLDDPFGHTDRGRRRRMLEILESEAGRRGHQVLLFTCRPEDFEGAGQHIPVGG